MLGLEVGQVNKGEEFESSPSGQLAKNRDYSNYGNAILDWGKRLGQSCPKSLHTRRLQVPQSMWSKRPRLWCPQTDVSGLLLIAGKIRSGYNFIDCTICSTGSPLFEVDPYRSQFAGLLKSLGNAIDYIDL